MVSNVPGLPEPAAGSLGCAGRRAARALARWMRHEIRPLREGESDRQLDAFDGLLGIRAGRVGDRAWDWLRFCAANVGRARGQVFQDLFVLFESGEKRDGWFVDFGATDGETISNTALLERDYGWRGILAEPARCWHDALCANRRAAIDQRCVWSVTGERLAFDEVDNPELSTASTCADAGGPERARRPRRHYEVETVTLDDLLSTHGAPRTIDYVSMDTEGSERRILEAFDFARWDVRLFTIEHNYTADREPIRRLMSGHGYRRVFEAFSLMDDWYVRP